jgi:hypothetical protein
MGWSVNRRVVVGLGLAVAALVCIGCARAVVSDVQGDRSLILPRPTRVVVFDFTTGPADVQVLSSPRQENERTLLLSQEQPDLLAEAVADRLATRLVEEIQSLGLSAERAAGGVPPEVNDLVIEGNFVRIDEGSRLQRFVIGLGVGATELRTQVRVFQVTTEGWKPVKQFETVATGSRFPGAGIGVAAGAVAGTVATSAGISSGLGVVGELRASINADAGRTAAQIAGKVAELKTAQHW